MGFILILNNQQEIIATARFPGKGLMFLNQITGKNLDQDLEYKNLVNYVFDSKLCENLLNERLLLYNQIEHEPIVRVLPIFGDMIIERAINSQKIRLDPGNQLHNEILFLDNILRNFVGGNFYLFKVNNLKEYHDLFQS